jgi:HD-GYP domain-containing protein (c-di-GMP phosphodiesterase class II)
MRNYVVKEIPAGSIFSKPIYLDEDFILATPEMPFSRDMETALEEWDFKEVLSDGEPKSEAFAQNADIAKAAELLLAVDPNNKDGVLKFADEFYRLFQKYTFELYAQVAKDEPFNAEAIADNVRVVCAVIRKHRHALLQVQPNHEAEADENYQIPHSIKTMIFSILIGTVLKLTDDRLIELGTAAILQEIGMLKLPTRLYSTKWSLTPDERKSILTHPILAYKLLKSYNFPQSVCLGVLEHHERENASGYPQKLTSEKIHLYAKIITVACSYEAITAHRPYRKAKDKHNGILEILKNDGKQ